MSVKTFCGTFFNKFLAINAKNIYAKNIHTSAIACGKINRMRSRSEMLKTVVKKEDGTRGENSEDIDRLTRFESTIIIIHF